MIFVLFVGFINGFFGGGGGMICVPALKILFNLDEKTAHKSSIFVMLIVSVPTFLILFQSNSISLLTLLLAFGVLIGGIIGSNLLKRLNEKVINIIFIVLILFSGIKMFF